MKQPGKKLGPRTINGDIIDVRTFSERKGWTEKKTRGMVERRLIPFKRLGGRIVFICSEVDAYFAALEGCSVKEALANMRDRQ